LREQRLIQTEALAQLGHVLRRRAFAEHRLRGVARDQVDQREHQRGNAEQHGHGQQHAANEIPEHSRPF
jgi:hypothetical protein